MFFPSLIRCCNKFPIDVSSQYSLWEDSFTPSLQVSRSFKCSFLRWYIVSFPTSPFFFFAMQNREHQIRFSSYSVTGREYKHVVRRRYTVCSYSVDPSSALNNRYHINVHPPHITLNNTTGRATERSNVYAVNHIIYCIFDFSFAPFEIEKCWRG